MTDAPETASTATVTVAGERAPITVSATGIQAIAVSVGLAAVAAIGVFTTLMRFWKAHDLISAMVYIQSSDFLAALAPIVTLITFFGIGARSFARWARERFMARKLPDKYARVAGDPPSRVAIVPITRPVDDPVRKI